MIFEYPTYLILGCILLSAGYALFLYANKKALKSFGKQRWLLASLRFVAVLMLGFLLLKPQFVNKTRIDVLPKFLVVKDVSNSVNKSSDSALIETVYQEVLQSVEGEFEVEALELAQELQSNLNTSQKKATNLGLLNDYVLNKYQDDNLKGVVVISDGIYNQGVNPVYQASGYSAPLYAVLAGDTQQVNDAWVERIEVNQSAVVNNLFEAKVHLLAKGFAGNKGELKVWLADSLVHQQTISVKKNNFSKSVGLYLSSATAGNKQMKAEWLILDEHKENNVAINYIDIVENQRKILLVFDAPHPDVNAINNAISSLQNTDVELLWAKEFNDSIAEFDGVITHGIYQERNRNILIAIEKANLTHFAILGQKVNTDVFNQFNKGTKVAESLGEPIHYTVGFNDDFVAFSIAEESKRLINRLNVPLLGEYLSFEFNKNAVPLGTMIFDGLETNDAVMVYNEDSRGVRSVIWQGEGYWQWRMLDYRLNRSFTGFDALVEQTVNYCISQQNKDRIQVEAEESWYETETSKVYVRVLDKTGQPTVNGKFDVDLRNAAGEKMEVNYVTRIVDYFIDLPYLPVGEYRLTAQAEINGEILKKKIHFTVLPFNLERINTTANPKLMFDWAKESGGAMFYLSEKDDLLQTIDNIPSQSLFYYEKEYESLIKQWWYLALVVLLLSVEWFLRKYWGSY